MGRATTSAAQSAPPWDFIAVYRHSVGDVYSYLASRTGDRSTAEDLTQEVFIAGARRFADGDEVGTAWLLAVARHKLIDHWHARSREDRKLALVHVSEPRHDGPIAPIDVGAKQRCWPSSTRPTGPRSCCDTSTTCPSPRSPRISGRTVEATEQVLTRARAAFRHVYQESDR